MAKRKYCFDDAGIEKLQSEGRGLGSGNDYIPWITTQLTKLQKTRASTIRGIEKPALTQQGSSERACTEKV